MHQEAVPKLGLGLGDYLLRLRQILDVEVERTARRTAHVIKTLGHRTLRLNSLYKFGWGLENVGLNNAVESPDGYTEAHNQRSSGSWPTQVLDYLWTSAAFNSFRKLLRNSVAQKMAAIVMRQREGGICIISSLPPPVGGVGVHVTRLSQRLSERGVRHQVLDDSRAAKPGVANLRHMSPLSFMRFIGRFEAIHIHTSNHFLRLLYTAIARMRGCQVLHTVHSARGSPQALVALRLSCRLAERTIAVSESVAQSIGGESLVIPAFIAPSAEEEELPDEVAAWLDTQSMSGRRIIAMNASVPAKIDGIDLYGLDMIVSAFERAELRERFSAIVCVASMRHGAEYYALLKARVIELGLPDRIKFVEDSINFAGALSKAQVFVRPTITDGDSISLREALWYGVPAIASDAVDRPQGTILFQSRDQACFEDKILQAVLEGARHAARKDFGGDVLAVYQKVLGGRFGEGISSSTSSRLPARPLR